LFLRGHEATTLFHVARRVAALLGCEYAGRYDARRRYPGRLFVFAVDPLLPAEARALGVASGNDVFGSVVPHEIVATKAITHELVSVGAARPPGWSSLFPARVRGAVLPGHTAFCTKDARTAAARLLDGGAVRVKDPREAGSRGQTVIERASDLGRVLADWDSAALGRHGIVLERNLLRVRTCSIGQLVVGRLVLSYYGEQHETRDNARGRAYGGSDLVCVRGGWDALARLDAPAHVRDAIVQARTYDEAAAIFPGFIATRRNYDVGQGVDAAGRTFSGVFEASWRPGRASGAEVAALHTLAPERRMIDIDIPVDGQRSRGRLLQPLDATRPVPGSSSYTAGAAANDRTSARPSVCAG
jgi:hypothetical protein